ncbi:MAG: TolC family protein [Herminiimonas sp.]|nr:TolC family protein [Herminiimonas sp.]
MLLARLAVHAAQAAIETAGVSPNPALTLGVAGVNPNIGIGSGNLRSKTVDSSVRIDQLFERGGKKVLRVQNAAALTDAAEQDAQETRRLLGIAVRQAFYDLLAAQQRVDITGQSAVLADATIKAARQRQQAGDLAPSDVTRLQVDALRARNDVTQASADQVRAQFSLLQLLGHGEQSGPITASEDWPQPAHSVALDAEALLAQRADVKAAMARLEAAQAASRLALAARTRDVSVGVQYDHYPSSAANTQGGGNTFSVAIQIPLFLRNQFDGEIRSAALAADSARVTLDKIRSAARNEIMRLLADQRSAAERLIRFDDELLPAAKKSADATEFAFNHGAIAIMDVLDVRRTYRLTQLDALAARTDHAKVLASLLPIPVSGAAP